MYQSSSCSGYGMNNSLSNCSPISYGQMQPRASYSGIQSYLAEGHQASPEAYMHFSKLETALADTKPARGMLPYSQSAYKGLYLNSKKNYFPTDAFLAAERPELPLVEQAGDIMPYIKDAFKELTGSEFPEDLIKVHILDDEKFEKAHMHTGGMPSPGVKGFSLNRQGKGIGEVFVREDHLDRMMLTIGHEIGHVMSPTLPDARDEEAKAFAFSIAWMKAIKEHNIAGIGNYIIPEPARNGLHDVAFEYLLELIERGKSAMELFTELAKGLLTIAHRIEVIYR